ncbi:MAG: hypothetical protein ACFCVK_03070 [Acidimicrobiales bacterium]
MTGRLRLPALVVVALALSAACAPTGGAGPLTAPEPGGRYTLVDPAADAAGPPDPVIVELDDEFGSLRIDAGCGTLLGAFSLLPDGRAGVTVAGGSVSDCEPGLARRQNELVDDLATVEAWDGDGDELRLEGGDATLVLRR